MPRPADGGLAVVADALQLAAETLPSSSRVPAPIDLEDAREGAGGHHGRVKRALLVGPADQLQRPLRLHALIV